MMLIHILQVRDLAMYFKSDKESFFLDFLATKAHDHHFTSSAWTEATKILEEKDLALGEKVAHLKVWSDGGLKTKENLYGFHQLAKEKGVSISVNFLGPYHGHSEVRATPSEMTSHHDLFSHSQCDGHFGAVKRRVKGDARDGPLTSIEQIKSAFATLKSSPKNQLIELDVQPDGVNLKPLKGQIRKFFEWEFSPDGTSRSRELTGSGEWKKQVFEQKTAKGKGKMVEEEEEISEE